MTDQIQSFIDRASDEIADKIVEQALAKATSRMFPTAPVEPQVTTNITWTKYQGPNDAEIVVRETKRSGKPVNPDSKRQRAFAYFAAGKSRKQVAFLTKLGKWTVNQYAREWNQMAPGRKA